MIEPKNTLKICLLSTMCLVLMLLNSNVWGHSSVTHQFDSARITVSLDFAYYQSNMDGAVNVTITKRNTSNAPVKVLRNLEEFQGWLKRDDVLTVSLDGVALNYIGPQVKELEPKEYDYLELEPGEIYTSTFRIDSAYNFSSVGEYEIKLLQRPGIEVDQENPSATIRVEVAGRQFKRTPNFLACGAAEQTAADEGLRVAEIYGIQSRNAMNSTAEADREKSPRYTTWFGLYDPARWNFVRSAYDKMASALSNQVITFNCACDANGIDPERVVAYVYSNQNYVINVCPLFFRYPTSGTNSKAGVIIHEMSHFEVIAGTFDHEYGQSNTRNLARSSPQQAIDNADSFHYFSENPGNLPMVSGSNSGGGGDSGDNDGGGSNDGGSGGPVDDPDQPQEPTPPEPEPEKNDYLTTIIGLLLETPHVVYSDFDRPPLGTLDPALPEGRSGKFNAVIHDDFGYSSASNPKYEYSQANANFRTRTYSGQIEIYWAGFGRSSDELVTDDSWRIRVHGRYGQKLVPGVYHNNVTERGLSHVLDFQHIYQRRLECDSGLTSTETRIHEISYSSDKVHKLKMDFIIYCKDDLTKNLRGSIDIDESEQDKLPNRDIGDRGEEFPQATPIAVRGTSIKLVRDNIYLGSPATTEEYSIGEAKLIFGNSSADYFYASIAVPGELFSFQFAPNGWTTVDYASPEDLVGYYDSLKENTRISRGEFGVYGTATGIFRLIRSGEQCSDSRSKLLIKKIDRYFQDVEFQFEHICQSNGDRTRGSVITNSTLPVPPYTGPASIDPDEGIPEKMPALESAGAKLLMVTDEEETLFDSREVRFDLKTTAESFNNYMMQLEVGGPAPLGIPLGLLFEPSRVLSDGTRMELLEVGVYASAGVSTRSANNTIHRLTSYNHYQSSSSCYSSGLYAVGKATIYEVGYNSNGEFEKLVGSFEIENCSALGSTVTYYLNYDLTLPEVNNPTPQPLGVSDTPYFEELEFRNTVMAFTEQESDSVEEKLWSGLLDTNFSIKRIEDGRGISVSWHGNGERSEFKFVRSSLLSDPNKNQALGPGVYNVKPNQDGGLMSIICQYHDYVEADMKVTIFEIEDSLTAEDDELSKFSASFEYECLIRDSIVKRAYHIKRDLTKPNFVPEIVLDDSPLIPTPVNSNENFFIYNEVRDGITQSIVNFVDEELEVTLSNRFDSLGIGNVAVTYAVGYQRYEILFLRDNLDLIPKESIRLEAGVYNILPQTNTNSAQVWARRSGNYDCRIPRGGRFRIKTIEYDSDDVLVKMSGDLNIDCGREEYFQGEYVEKITTKSVSFGFDRTTLN